MVRGTSRLVWLVALFALGVDQAASAQDTNDAHGRIEVGTERRGGRADTGPAVLVGTRTLVSPESPRRAEPASFGDGSGADSPTRQSDGGALPTRVEDAKHSNWILEGTRGLEPDRA